MNFNKHQEYEGKHAFMGASQFRWIEWDSTTLMERYYSRYAQEIGTVLHSLAQNCIKARIRLSKADLHLVDLFDIGMPLQFVVHSTLCVVVCSFWPDGCFCHHQTFDFIGIHQQYLFANRCHYVDRLAI